MSSPSASWLLSKQTGPESQLHPLTIFMTLGNGSTSVSLYPHQDGGDN